MVNGDPPVNGLSQAAIGRAMDLSPAAVTKLKKQGMPVDSVESAMAWRQARQNIAQRKPLPPALRGLEVPPPSSEPSGPPQHTHDETQDQARTRREIAEANLAELKLRELRGELVRVADVRADHSRLLVSLRETFMQFPARVVPMLVAAADPAAMDRVLRDEISTALRLVAEAE